MSWRRASKCDAGLRAWSDRSSCLSSDNWWFRLRGCSDAVAGRLPSGCAYSFPCQEAERYASLAGGASPWPWGLSAAPPWFSLPHAPRACGFESKAHLTQNVTTESPTDDSRGPHRSAYLTPAEGSWLVKASCGLRSAEGSRGTWLRSSVSRGGGSPCSGAGAYLRHAAATGDMKPCGHDHRELTHLTRPHRSVGHADTASRPMAVARSHAASVRQRISPPRTTRGLTRSRAARELVSPAATWWFDLTTAGVTIVRASVPSMAMHVAGPCVSPPRCSGSLAA